LKSALAALCLSSLGDSVASAPLSSSYFSFQLSTFSFSSLASSVWQRSDLLSFFNFQLSAFSFSSERSLHLISAFSFQLSTFSANGTTVGFPRLAPLHHPPSQARRAAKAPGRKRHPDPRPLSQRS
jgi:hypothetical protein